MSNIRNTAKRLSNLIEGNSIEEKMLSFSSLYRKHFVYFRSIFNSDELLELLFHTVFYDTLDSKQIQENLNNTRSITIIRNEGWDSYKECEICDGSGEVDCSECVSGDIECNNCRSQGDVECDVCDGTGIDGDEECSVCDSDGRVECSDCDGSGYERCTDCGGSGNIECDTCEGDGQVKLEDYEDAVVRSYVSFDKKLNREIQKYEGKIISWNLLEKLSENSFLSLSVPNVAVEKGYFPEGENFVFDIAKLKGDVFYDIDNIINKKFTQATFTDFISDKLSEKKFNK